MNKHIVKLINKDNIVKVPIGNRTNAQFLKKKNQNGEYFEVTLPFSRHGFWKLIDETGKVIESNIAPNEEKNIKKDIELKQKEYTNNISSMLEAKAKELGFQTFYTASAYLTQADNPLKSNAEKIGVWGGNVWGKAMKIKQQVENGEIEIPATWEKMKGILPKWEN